MKNTLNALSIVTTLSVTILSSGCFGEIEGGTGGAGKKSEAISSIKICATVLNCEKDSSAGGLALTVAADGPAYYVDPPTNKNPLSGLAASKRKGSLNDFQLIEGVGAGKQQCIIANLAEYMENHLIAYEAISLKPENLAFLPKDTNKGNLLTVSGINNPNGAPKAFAFKERLLSLINGTSEGIDLYKAADGTSIRVRNESLTLVDAQNNPTAKKANIFELKPTIKDIDFKNKVGYVEFDCNKPAGDGTLSLQMAPFLLKNALTGAKKQFDAPSVVTNANKGNAEESGSGTNSQTAVPSAGKAN